MSPRAVEASKTGRAYPIAPVTFKFLVTKTWCGQLKWRRAVECVVAWASVRECPLSGLGGGQRALEGGPVGRPAVRRKHVLDRQCEERAQPLGDLLARHARAEPPLVDLEAPAEVDEGVA